MDAFGKNKLDDLYAYVVATLILDFMPVTDDRFQYFAYIRRRTQHVGIDYEMHSL